MRVLTAAAWGVCACILLGCGGGGGSSAETGVPSNTATPSSLVPAAPALGAVVATDATAWYPLRPGAKWHYRGSSSQWITGQPPPPSYAHTYFTDDLSHVASGGSGVIETNSNAFDGGSSQSEVTHVSGSVVSASVNTTTLASRGQRAALGLTPANLPLRKSLAVGTGTQPMATPAASSSNAAALLRSPIQVGDQWTLRELRGASAEEDFDGDGRVDTYDEGFYARVVGAEQIDLQSLKGVSAVRVDYVQRIVVHFTATRSSSEVIETRMSTWYAQHIGVVKTQLDEPTASSDQRHIVVEVLDTWDGVTEGIGALPSQPGFAVVNGVTGDRLGAPLDVLGLDDHALVLTPLNGAQLVDGISLSVVDGRGRVQETHHYPGAVFLEPRLVRAGTGAMVVGRAWSGDAGWIAMTLDARGANASAPFYLSRGLSSGQDTFQVASDGSRIWVLWKEAGATPTDNTLERMHLAAYDAAGNTVVATRTLDDMPDIRDLSLAASDGKGLAGWTVLIDGARTIRYVRLDGATSGPVQTGPATIERPVAWVAGAIRGFYRPRDALNLVLDEAGSVPMDANGDVVLQRWHPNEGVPEIQWGVNAVSGETAGSLVALQAAYLSYWPEEPFSTYTVVISSYQRVQGAWQPSLIGRAAWADMGNPQYVVPLGNQVLVVGYDYQGRMLAGTVWRRQ